MAGLLGSDFDTRKITAWCAARKIVGRDPNVMRMDDFGSVILWSEYGKRNSDFGWEIDHRHPTALGGGDGLSNLRALNWRNNASLGGCLGNAKLG